MRRTTIALLSGMLCAAMLLGGCGRNQESKVTILKKTPTPAASQKETATPTPEVTAESAEKTAQTGGDVDVKKMEGVYLDQKGKKGTIRLMAKDSKVARILIDWPDTTQGNPHWEMTGTYDPEKKQLVYTDATMTRTITRNGKRNTETVYTKGSGNIAVDGTKLTWNDAQAATVVPQSLFVYEMPLEMYQSAPAAPTVTPIVITPGTPTPDPLSANAVTPTPAPLDPNAVAPVPTEIPTPVPTAEPTKVPVVTAPPAQTPAPAVTQAPAPVVTETPAPAPTEAPAPVVTEAPAPAPTEAPEPVVTEAPAPAPTEAPEPVVTEAPAPAPTEAPEPVVTEAPAPEPAEEQYEEPAADPYAEQGEPAYEEPAAEVAGVPDEQQTAETGGWQEASSIEEAVSLAGFEYDGTNWYAVPGLSPVQYQYQDGSVQVGYADEEQTAYLTITKTKISTEEGENAVGGAWEFDAADGVTVYCNGSSDSVSSASFEQDGSVYTIEYAGTDEGSVLTEDDCGLLVRGLLGLGEPAEEQSEAGDETVPEGTEAAQENVDAAAAPDAGMSADPNAAAPAEEYVDPALTDPAAAPAEGYTDPAAVPQE